MTLITNTKYYCLIIIQLCILFSSCVPKGTPDLSGTISSENIVLFDFTKDIEYLRDNFDKFVIDGSTTMIPLHQSLRDRFSSNDSKVKHSKTVDAFESFLEGTTHILLSVDYSDELLNRAKDSGIMLAKKEITKEGFVFLINRNNTVQNLTIQQIKDIYSDKIKNWNEVGGDDMPIRAYQRNSDSGSQIRMVKFMGENVLTDRVVNYLSGMGYVIKLMNDYDSGQYSIAYNMYTFTEKQYPSEDVVLLSVNGINPTDETIFNETYPIFIYNYIYYDSNNTIVSEFVEKLYAYLMTDEGQELISDSGYININNQLNRNLNIDNPDFGYRNVEYINLGWRNKEKNEFYDMDYKTKELFIYYNYPEEDKYVLRTMKKYINDSYRETIIRNFQENINNIADSDIVLRRNDLKDIYFCSYRIDPVTKRFNFNVLF